MRLFRNFERLQKRLWGKYSLLRESFCEKLFAGAFLVIGGVRNMKNVRTRDRHVNTWKHVKRTVSQLVGCPVLNNQQTKSTLRFYEYGDIVYAKRHSIILMKYAGWTGTCIFESRWWSHTIIRRLASLPFAYFWRRFSHFKINVCEYIMKSSRSLYCISSWRWRVLAVVTFGDWFPARDRHVHPSE